MKIFKLIKLSPFTEKRRRKITKAEEIYLCEIGSNKVRILEGGKKLVCCGKPIKIMKR